MTEPMGNISASGDVIPDAELTPVPCKCCGGVHPACGCWNLANADQLAGHACLKALDGRALSVVWHPDHPSQQRTAIAFHVDRYAQASTQRRIMEAALATLLTWDPYPDVLRAMRQARIERDQAHQVIEASLAFLDAHDVTGKHHTRRTEVPHAIDAGHQHQHPA